MGSFWLQQFQKSDGRTDGDTCVSKNIPLTWKECSRRGRQPKCKPSTPSKWPKEHKQALCRRPDQNHCLFIADIIWLCFLFSICHIWYLGSSLLAYFSLSFNQYSIFLSKTVVTYYGSTENTTFWQKPLAIIMFSVKNPPVWPVSQII